MRLLPLTIEDQAGRATPFDRSQPLRVRAEAIGSEPTPWGWAIYRGANRVLIVRSRPDYQDEAGALDAGLKAAGVIGNRLRTEVIVEPKRAREEPV